MLKEQVKALTLAERIEIRAQEVHSDERSPVIAKIIEARGVIAQLRLRGRSWAKLVAILEAEGVHLSQGTLRNYMARIGKAEAALKDEGEPEPTNEDIRAILWRKSPKKPAVSDPQRRPQQADAKHEHEVRMHRPMSGPIISSLSRDPNREL